MWCVWVRREMLIGFWWVNLNARGQLENQGIDGRIILK
jgi:hypothetical protein